MVSKIKKDGWNDLRCGYAVKLADGVPVRLSDKECEEVVDEATLLREILQLTGYECQIGEFASNYGEPDATAEVVSASRRGVVTR